MLGMIFVDDSIIGLANVLGSFGLAEGTSLWVSALLSAIVASTFCVGLFAFFWKYKGKVIRDNGIHLGFIHIPELPRAGNFLTTLHLPSPKIKFDISGFKGIAGAIGIVAVGFAGAFTLVIATTDDTPIWPETGAAYSLPSTIGKSLPPDVSTPSERSQTLQINLGNAVRLDTLTLKNIDLGKAGLTNAFEINRTTGVTGAQVSVGIITIRNSSAPTLDWANMEAGCITLAGKVDGHTNAISIDSTISTLVIDSDRGAGTYTAENSTVDRIVINTNGDSGATIGELIIDDVDTSVGAWDWDYIKAGCINLEATNQFGNGTGINTASAVFNSSVKARVITDNLVDTPLTVK
jgi:hypothetical protein